MEEDPPHGAAARVAQPIALPRQLEVGAAPLRPAPRPPSDVVAFVIGDLHAQVDLVRRATAEIEARAEDIHRPRRSVVVFLGDYIDRGPAACETIEHLMELKDRFGEVVFLRGNHEQVLLDLVDGVETSTRWLEFGGRQTLASYGVEPRRLNPGSATALRALLLAHLPQSHIAFLRQTEVTRSLGDYLCVHGGLKPDRLLSEHSDHDLMWFRYVVDEAPLWKHMVVHGHAAHIRPVEGRSHIGIDTGAYATGALTVLRLEGASREFLKVSRSQSSGSLEVDVWERRDSAYPENGFDLAEDWSRSGAGPVRFWDRLGLRRRH